jgi:hypothetical protein
MVVTALDALHNAWKLYMKIKFTAAVQLERAVTGVNTD